MITRKRDTLLELFNKNRCLLNLPCDIFNFLHPVLGAKPRDASSQHHDGLHFLHDFRDPVFHLYFPTENWVLRLCVSCSH